MAEPERAPIRVVGRYALYNEIAAGGMATIHLGRLLGPVGFARTVAVKRLHPQYARDPEFVSMFLDEARLAARVQHPNVVATIDVVASEGELFLIMDYVRGESLSKILRGLRKKKQLVPPQIAASILCGFLHGLHAAHEAKNERGEPLSLVHRDVSPQNVLVGSDGIARVLDFGIAKAQGRLQVTMDGQIKGKLAYMPPEQVSGKELSRAADIYASAVVMWEVLTNERLFKGPTETETLSRILRDPVPAPSSVVPGLEPFDAVLLKSLDRDPTKRHATARELALELERCVGLASATIVGEWVETNVGSVLNAREAQIAEIESSSAGMTIPSPESSDTLSDSNSSLRDLAAVGRLTHGSEGPRITTASDRGHTVVIGPRDFAVLRQGTGSIASGDDATLTRKQPDASELRSGTMSLPIDRRLPIFASIAGVAVLLVSVGLVLRGTYSSAGRALKLGRITPVPISAAPATTDSAAAVPLEASSATPAPEASEVAPSPPPTGAPSESAAGPSSPTSSATTRASATSAPRITPKATSNATTTTKSSCDPPYTIDAAGHRKYKRECM